jgi:hypothetical protein
MVVLASVEIHLADRIEPTVSVGIDQQSDVDSVASKERQSLDQLTPHRKLASQRLAHSCKVGVEEVEERPGCELCYPATAFGQRYPSLAKRPAVEALYQRKAIVFDERPDQPASEVFAEVV